MGSKIVSFLLVPLYTYYLSQGEYGALDLVMTTVSMLLPIVSASMFEAIIRFVVDKLLIKWNNSKCTYNCTKWLFYTFIVLPNFLVILIS